MNFAFFVHSLASDWNHGNAHFLRGVIAELLARGHDVTTHEQRDAWSPFHLRQVEGVDVEASFANVFPHLAGVRRLYDVGTRHDTFADPDFADVAEASASLDLPTRLTEVDVCVVHEWTPPAVVAALGRFRREHGGPALWFHDTHHRIVSEPEKVARFDLSGYDGVLAFGAVLRDAYVRRGWPAGRVVVWHEAADVRTFAPREATPDADLVWVGNWGDGERSEELRRFLLGPAKTLGLTGEIRGVRYPHEGLSAVRESGLRFRGYVPNHDVPALFARHRVTCHVPRRWYVTDLPGIPTIRVFEALACGIPLVCAAWDDRERLFHPGRDYLTADTTEAMRDQIRRVLREPNLAADLAACGLETVTTRHTCGHRVDELLAAVS